MKTKEGMLPLRAGHVAGGAAGIAQRGHPRIREIGAIEWSPHNGPGRRFGG